MTEISALKMLLLLETTATDSMTEEDKQKMQRNYQKFQLEIQGRILQDLTEDIRDFKDTLKKDYYKEKVVKYENEDDEHRWRTAVVRQCLSSPLDRIKQNAIDWATFVSDVVNGAKMAVLDLIEGLASLAVIVYYGWRANVAMLVEATASNPPDWVDDALKDYDKHVYPLTTILTDPIAVVESLAQTASDTFEKEGGTYAASYLITDFIVGKLLSDITKIDGPSTKGKGGNDSIITPDMKSKILDGQRVGNTNRVKGGHSPKINNDNSDYATEIQRVNPDGTKKIKYVKQFSDGDISKIKTSTLFPDSWSDDKIIQSIKKVGNGTPIGYRARDGATIYRATVDGVEIEVIKIGDKVVSGYPTGGGVTGLPSGFTRY